MLLPSLFSAGIMVALPVQAPLRTMFVCLTLHSGGNLFILLVRKRIPLAWNLCILGFMAAWVLFLLLGLSTRLSFKLFTLVLLVFSAVLPVVGALRPVLHNLRLF